MNNSLNFVFVYVLRIKIGESNCQQFIFDSGLKKIGKNRISLFVENGQLVFRVSDKDGIDSQISVDVTLFTTFSILSCEIRNGPNCELVLTKNFGEVAKTNCGYPIIFSGDPTEESYYIGSSNEEKDLGYFSLARQLVFNQIIDDESRNKLLAYFLGSDSLNPKNYAFFNGNSFLRRDIEGIRNLVQPDPRFQPQYINE